MKHRVIQDTLDTDLKIDQSKTIEEIEKILSRKLDIDAFNIYKGGNHIIASSKNDRNKDGTSRQVFRADRR